MRGLRTIGCNLRGGRSRARSPQPREIHAGAPRHGRCNAATHPKRRSRMRRLHCMTMFVALVAIAGCGGELSTPQASDGEELLPQDPAGLTYEDEPDAWAEAPGTVGEGEAAGVYAIDSCRLHNGIANGNYTRLTPYQVAALAHRQGVACGANLVRAVAITGAES